MKVLSFMIWLYYSALCIGFICPIPAQTSDTVVDNPIQAYVAYRYALRKNDPHAVKQCLARSLIAEWNRTSKTYRMVRRLSPKQVDIIYQEVHGETALLEASGDKDVMQGKIKMVVEQGQWKVAGEEWRRATPGALEEKRQARDVYVDTYTRYLTARRNRNMEGMEKVATDFWLAEITDPTTKHALPSSGFQVRCREIDAAKGRARLFLEANDTTAPYGTVQLVKDENTWKVDSEAWKKQAHQVQKHVPDPALLADIEAVNLAFFAERTGGADVQAIMRNNGATTIRKVTYTFSVNDFMERGSIRLNCPPGAQANIDLSGAFTRYYHGLIDKGMIHQKRKVKLSVILDPENLIQESNEENNRVTAFFTLNP